MKNGVNFLCELIKGQYSVEIYGKQFVGDGISLPKFYLKDSKLCENGIYICKTSDLPSFCDKECIFICTGEKPIVSPDRWNAHIIHIVNKDIEIFEVFNFVIGCCTEIMNWEYKMNRLIINNASVFDLIEASLPIFKNHISVVDYSLRILAGTKIESKNGKPKPFAVRGLDFLPYEIFENFSDKYERYIRNTEPYFIEDKPSDTKHKNYCINIFGGGKYILTCILRDEINSLKESDCILFDRLAEYIDLAVKPSSAEIDQSIITLKNMLINVLNGITIRENDSNILSKNLSIDVHNASWRCAVITQLNAEITLPENYACSTIEKLVPNSTAVGYNSNIVCLYKSDRESNSKVENILLPYIKKNKMHMGISGFFTDISDAKQYYSQALALLASGYKYFPEESVYTVDGTMLNYMLHNCSGEFNTDTILSDGLKALKNLDSSVDYWNTLKVYLDNECNASKTANELFIHRSTLLTRLEKIESLVDLDTPQARLYVRMCMNICKQIYKK